MTTTPSEWRQLYREQKGNKNDYFVFQKAFCRMLAYCGDIAEGS